MNGRIQEAETPEGRLAAVVISVLKSRPDAEMWKLDYADFEEALRPYLRKELLNAQLEVVRRMRTYTVSTSVIEEKQLFQELATTEGEILMRQRQLRR